MLFETLSTFQIRRSFPSFSCSASVCKLYNKPVTSTISYIAHSLIPYLVVKIFDCDVFLSKLISVFLIDEKLFTIMSLVLSLERKRLISIPEWELSFMMSLNSRCFSREKQTPRFSVLSFGFEKLKYLFLSLNAFIGVTSERYPGTETSK